MRELLLFLLLAGDKAIEEFETGRTTPVFEESVQRIIAELPKNE